MAAIRTAYRGYGTDSRRAMANPLQHHRDIIALVVRHLALWAGRGRPALRAIMRCRLVSRAWRDSAASALGTSNLNLRAIFAGMKCREELYRDVGHLWDVSDIYHGYSLVLPGSTPPFAYCQPIRRRFSEGRQLRRENRRFDEYFFAMQFYLGAFYETAYEGSWPRKIPRAVQALLSLASSLASQA